MRRLLLFAAALLLPLTAWAAEPAAPTITIIVPSGEILPGDDVDLAVTGVLPADLTPGKVFFLPPENATARCKLIIQWSALGQEPVITFRAKSPGAYRVCLVKALPNEKLLAATAVVTVGGPNPDPFPDPKPDPQPVPGSRFQVVIIQPESGRTPDQAAVWFAKELREYLTKQGHGPLQPLDLHSKPVPKELAGVFSSASVAGKTLPRLYLATLDGKAIVYEGDPPATVPAFLTLLKSKGG